MIKTYKLKLRLYEKLSEKDRMVQDENGYYYYEYVRVGMRGVERKEFKGYCEYNADYLDYMVDVLFYKYKKYLRYIITIKDLKLSNYKIDNLSKEPSKISLADWEFDGLKKEITKIGKIEYTYDVRGTKIISRAIICKTDNILRLDEIIIDDIKNNKLGLEFLKEIEKNNNEERKKEEEMSRLAQAKYDIENREKYGRCVECGSIRYGGKCTCGRG